MARRSVMAAAFLTAFFAAHAANADCALLIVQHVIPFDGLRVPSNAELRVLSPPGTSFVVTFPDGEQGTVTVVADDIGQRLDLPAPLAVGAYTLERVEEELVFTFTVEDVVDEESPSTPTATAAQSTVFIPPDLLGLGDDCVETGAHDNVTLTIEGGAAGDAVVVDGFIASFVNVNGDAELTHRESRGGDVAYDIALRDLAGNDGEATRVEVWAGCPGGCASTSSTPLAALLVLLLLRRRRRRCSP